VKLIYRHLITLGVFVAAGTVSCWLWQQENRHTALERRSSQDTQLRETTSSMEQRMHAYEQVLRSVQGLLALPGHPERADLRLFVESLQLGADFNGMDGLGIVMRAAKPVRGVSAPIVQMEPATARNQRLLDWDLYADPAQRAAMDAARDSGRVAISGKVPLASEGGTATQAGFMMFLPIYRDGAQPNSVADRRAHLVGWVMAPVRMGELMASLYGQRGAGSDIRVYDGVQLAPGDLLFGSSGTPEPGDVLVGWVTEYMVIAGRTWVLAIRPQSGAAGLGNEASDIIAVSGLTLSLLLAALTWVLLTGRARALTAARQMTTELREMKDHFELIFNAGPDSVVIKRLEDGEILNINDGFTAMTGYSRSEVIGVPIQSLKLWENPPERQRYLAALKQQGACDNMEAMFRTRAGALFVGIVSARTASFKGTQCIVAVIRDISERKATELRMTHMAQHDPLTGLPNRALFTDRLQHAVSQARRDQSCLALMYLDLDKFKPVNDTQGHAVGDLLLKAVAARMLECVRQSDTVGRMGGDEFVVLLPTIRDEQDVMLVAEKIRLALNEPFDLEGGHRANVSSSAGIAIYPEHGDDELQLSQNADTAMYLAKARGRNRVELYVPTQGVE
jgi:diguanylate cyclase (GGDEF)-like protein/PAS domain S-box-containing protein